MTLTEAEIQAFERYRFEALRDEARLMTSLGLEGEDPRDPRVADFLALAERQTDDLESLKAFVARYWRPRS